MNKQPKIIELVGANIEQIQEFKYKMEEAILNNYSSIITNCQVKIHNADGTVRIINTRNKYRHLFKSNKDKTFLQQVNDLELAYPVGRVEI